MKFVIKIGGSFQKSQILKEVCRTIDRNSQSHDLVVVPGGGVFADQVRKFQKDHEISDMTAHLMAVLAMEIYGLGLDELIPRLELSNSLKDAESGGVIFLPYRSVKERCELEPSWRVTSDSLAAWTCGQLGFDKLILIKRVDGIFDTDRLPSLTHREFKSLNQTVVDPRLPEVLEKFGITGWIINGEHPKRIEELLKKGETKSTKICPEERS